jgi:hypothetical protein
LPGKASQPAGPRWTARSWPESERERAVNLLRELREAAFYGDVDAFNRRLDEETDGVTDKMSTTSGPSSPRHGRLRPRLVHDPAAEAAGPVPAAGVGKWCS